MLRQPPSEHAVRQASTALSNMYHFCIYEEIWQKSSVIQNFTFSETLVPLCLFLSVFPLVTLFEGWGHDFNLRHGSSPASEGGQ